MLKLMFACVLLVSGCVAPTIDSAASSPGEGSDTQSAQADSVAGQGGGAIAELVAPAPGASKDRADVVARLSESTLPIVEPPSAGHPEDECGMAGLGDGSLCVPVSGLVYECPVNRVGEPTAIPTLIDVGLSCEQMPGYAPACRIYMVCTFTGTAYPRRS